MEFDSTSWEVDSLVDRGTNEGWKMIRFCAVAAIALLATCVGPSPSWAGGPASGVSADPDVYTKGLDAYDNAYSILTSNGMSPAAADELAKVVAAESANGFANGVTQESFNEELARDAKLHAAMSSFYGMLGTAADPKLTVPPDPALSKALTHLTDSIQLMMVQSMMGRGGLGLGGAPIGPSLAGPDGPIAPPTIAPSLAGASTFSNVAAYDNAYSILTSNGMSPAAADELAKVVAAESANGFANGVTQEAFNEDLARDAKLHAAMSSFYGMLGTAADPKLTAPPDPALHKALTQLTDSIQLMMVQSMMGRGGSPMGGVPIGP